MPQIPTSLDDVLLRGIACHQAGKFSEAESIYRQILVAHPNHADAWHLLGVIAHQLGRHDIAIELISRAIQHHDHASYHYNLALALRALGRDQEAAVALGRVIERDGTHAEARATLGAILQKQGDLVAAAESYRTALALNPKQAATHNNLAYALLLLGNAQQSLAAVEQALALDPNLAQAHNTRGNVLRHLGGDEEARASYERAIELVPDYADAHFNLGSLLQQQAKLEAALEQFERVLTLTPGHFEANLAFAHVLAELGRRAEAIIQYRRTLSLRPRHAETLTETGALYLEMGKREEASAMAKEAEQCADRPSVAIGVLLLRCGLIGEARDHLEDCLGHEEAEAAGIVLASMGLRDVPARTNDAEVRKFYSHLAQGWDEKMRLGERYFGPALAASAADRLLGDRTKVDILDVGCGTGLAAPFLRGRASRLDGVDLSPDMLAQARAKQLYDNLIEDDLARFLRARPESYDLIVSVAALIMSRDLAPSFAAAYDALRPDGLFVMTLFPHDDESEREEGRLQINGTYTHGRTYVLRLATECGYGVELIEEHVHELARGTPVNGLLVGLRKNPRHHQ